MHAHREDQQRIAERKIEFFSKAQAKQQEIIA